MSRTSRGARNWPRSAALALGVPVVRQDAAKRLGHLVPSGGPRARPAPGRPSASLAESTVLEHVDPWRQGDRHPPRPAPVKSTKNSEVAVPDQEPRAVVVGRAERSRSASTASAAVAWRASSSGSSPRDRFDGSLASPKGWLVSPAHTPYSLTASHVPPGQFVPAPQHPWRPFVEHRDRRSTVAPGARRGWLRRSTAHRPRPATPRRGGTRRSPYRPPGRRTVLDVANDRQVPIGQLPRPTPNSGQPLAGERRPTGTRLRPAFRRPGRHRHGHARRGGACRLIRPDLRPRRRVRHRPGRHRTQPPGPRRHGGRPRRGHARRGPRQGARTSPGCRATWPTPDWTSGRTFDVVVMAGNVLIFVAPGTEGEVIETPHAGCAPGGRLVTGYSIRPEGFGPRRHDTPGRPGRPGPRRTAGRPGTSAPFAPGDSYAVAVHRREI